MSAVGLGLVVGWCVVGYAATRTSRGWLAVGVLVLAAAVLTATVAQPWTAALRSLGAAGVAAVVHLGLRRVLSARARRVAA